MAKTTEAVSADEAEQLRQHYYNAQVLDMQFIHEDLLVMRVRPDRGIPEFDAGQYTVLGLGYWEPRVPGTQTEQPTPAEYRRVIKRAYSLSCSLELNGDRPRRVKHYNYLEFYVALVRHAVKRPPALTPRLFALRAGDRIFCGPHFHGHYSIARVSRDSTVILAATGTGEAPHNAMIADLLAWGHRGQIASVVCVRNRRDLGYVEQHTTLGQRFPNYHHVSLTTRESENTDPGHPQYVGKRYLQDYFDSGELERDTGITLDPQNTHVFLCGSPDMIGVARYTHNLAERYPQPRGMVEVLERHGFQIDQPHEPGNIHFEKYW